MKKICFFDIDGTLLDYDKQLPFSTKQSIFSLKEKGVYVAIATGRAPFMFEELRKELEIESFVCFNGQYVVFENEVIYRNPLPKESLRKLLREANEYANPIVLMNEQTAKGTVAYSRHIEETLLSFNIAHPEQDEFFYENNDIYQSLLYCTPDEENRYSDMSEYLRFIRWHPVCVDVTPVNGSKAHGIQQFIKRAGFELDNVYAFGDGLNDIEMIRTVGTGIVMGNAEQELLKHADVITTNVDDNGIYNGLRMVGLL